VRSEFRIFFQIPRNSFRLRVSVEVKAESRGKGLKARQTERTYNGQRSDIKLKILLKEYGESYAC
jgi:hypothetical protein